MGTEGNMGDGVKRESSLSPARSETPSTHRSFMHGTWEIPLQSSAERLDLSGKATGNEPDGNRGGKSDDCVLPKKQPNAAQAVEAVEGRPSTKRNTVRAAAVRTQSRVAASPDLQRVREAARRDKRARFTALLHHITVQRLRESFYALKRSAVPGVDGVVWKEYLQGLDSRLSALHTAVHRGSYRAQPVRRTYIPKTDGTERPLGVASQGAVRMMRWMRLQSRSRSARSIGSLMRTSANSSIRLIRDGYNGLWPIASGISVF
jgi:RNA-directed DNA polymerase